MATMVTTEYCIVAVDHETCTAPRTHRFPTACCAQQRGREAAPVDEQQRLFVLREASANRLLQRRRDAFDIAPIAAPDQAYDGERAMSGRALRQLEPEISAAFSLRVAFERRRGAAENDGHAAQLRSKNCDIARMIADPVLLFERGIVFLVHDDQSQARQRREHGQTRSDQKLDFSPCRSQPACPALESSKPTV